MRVRYDEAHEKQVNALIPKALELATDQMHAKARDQIHLRSLLRGSEMGTEFLAAMDSLAMRAGLRVDMKLLAPWPPVSLWAKKVKVAA